MVISKPSVLWGWRRRVDHRVPPLLLAALLVGGAAAGKVSPPLTVSPGEMERSTTVPACPTFSWGGVEEAVSYELAIFRIGESGVEPEPLLLKRVPGSARSWTPAFDLCLEGGAPYVWSIRAATDENVSDWAEIRFFETAQAPTLDELAAALELARRAAGTRPEGEADPERTPPTSTPPVRTVGWRPAGPAGALEVETARVSVAEVPQASAPTILRSTAASAAAKLTVVGEVRTLDETGEPRLWGRGREDVGVYGAPGGFPCFNFDLGIQFGLSTVGVDWGSAADACPAGSWVCRKDEVVACNTTRPDAETQDALKCDGGFIGLPEDEHRGWVSGQTPGARHSGSVFAEHGTSMSHQTCVTFPVWCCWE